MQRALLLAGVLLVLLAWPAAAAAAPPVTPTLIVEYRPAALRTVDVASADVGAAAATAAVVAAQSWGASEGKQATIAATASAAATAAPAVAAVSASVASSAMQRGIRLVSQTNYATVMHGAAFRTRSAADARRLQRQLERNPSVARVWYAVSGHGPQALTHMLQQDALAQALMHAIPATHYSCSKRVAWWRRSASRQAPVATASPTQRRRR